MEDYILDIQRMSTEDGPGIRTTVFFKGCNLQCKWCHNPESIAFQRQKYWVKDKCIACFSCQEVCPQQAITFNEDGMQISSNCNFCLHCVEACPANAIEVKGEIISVDKLFSELLKDLSYYHKDGGVTFSGGEAVLHHEYLYELMKKLKAAGIHTAIDTAGAYPYEVLEKLLPYTDLLLYDLKIFTNAKHKYFTGVDNDLIKANAIKLGKLEYPKIWIRTPIIPGATDDEENIRQLGEFIREYMPNIEKWELVSFNNLSREKYRLLGKVWDYQHAELIAKAKMMELTKIAQEYMPQAVWSGATKLEV